MKIKADRDIFRWRDWSLTSLELKQLQIKAKMPTCSKNAQAKPTEDGSEGEKIINQ